MILANLGRASDLIQRFKPIAVEQICEEIHLYARITGLADVLVFRVEWLAGECRQSEINKASCPVTPVEWRSTWTMC